MIDPASRLHGHHHEREMMMMMMTYRQPLCVLFQLFTVLEVPIEPPTHVEQHARHIKPTQVEVRSCKKQQRERFSASRQHPLSLWCGDDHGLGPFRCCCCGQPAKPNAWLRATTSVTFNPLIIFLAPAQNTTGERCTAYSASSH